MIILIFLSPAVIGYIYEYADFRRIIHYRKSLSSLNGDDRWSIVMQLMLLVRIAISYDNTACSIDGA